MHVFKIKTKDGWVSLYRTLMNLFVRKDKNLADLENKDEALTNLGLTGDVTSHNHDNRYLPLIQEAEDRVMEALDETKEEIKKNMLSEHNGSLSELINMDNGWYKWQGTIESVTGTWIIVKMDTLYQATCMDDPRVVLNSGNLNTWYSPYGYWHA